MLILLVFMDNTPTHSPKSMSINVEYCEEGNTISFSFWAKPLGFHPSFFFHLLSIVALNPMHYRGNVTYSEFDGKHCFMLFCLRTGFDWSFSMQV
jgi:hypothetical protein